MNVVPSIRAWQLQPLVAARRRAHESGGDAAARLDTQLELFHRQWREIRAAIPYYAHMAGPLPATFRSWQEVLERLPICNRATIQEHGQRMRDPRRTPQWSRMTGGSTSQPIQLPAWHSENKSTNPDVWMARGWYGVTPRDRLFLLWGHSHLLGSGLRGRWRGWQRQLKDRALGYCRYSAYDLSETNLRAAGAKLLQVRPGYLIGYSVALDRFARCNLDRREALRALGVKVIVGCAEAFPADDSERLLSDLFAAPVAMEYGSVETGLVGHTHPRGGFDVFWNTYFVEATEPGPNGGQTIRVTSLYPRCFPLIRYELGDELLPSDEERLGLARFQAVHGRCNAYVELRDGTRIHSEAITHCVRPCRSVTAYQAVQSDEAIELRLTAASEVTREMAAEIRQRLRGIHPLLEQVVIRRVDALEQSVAGKTPMILRRTSPAKSHHDASAGPA